MNLDKFKRWKLDIYFFLIHCWIYVIFKSLIINISMLSEGDGQKFFYDLNYTITIV